jgi:hypothetical protein
LKTAHSPNSATSAPQGPSVAASSLRTASEAAAHAIQVRNEQLCSVLAARLADSWTVRAEDWWAWGIKSVDGPRRVVQIFQFVLLFWWAWLYDDASPILVPGSVSVKKSSSVCHLGRSNSCVGVEARIVRK